MTMLRFLLYTFALTALPITSHTCLADEAPSNNGSEELPASTNLTVDAEVTDEEVPEPDEPDSDTDANETIEPVDSLAESRNMLSLQAGTGQASLMTTRISLQRTWRTTWWEEGKWFLTGYTDYAAGFWWNDEELPEGKFDREEEANEVAVISFSPVYRLERKEPAWGSTYPYIDFGIGVAWLSENNIENSHELSRDLGSDFQFEDRFGIGGRFGKNKRKEFGYTLIHYSNAGYDETNTGITLHFLKYAFSF